MVVQRIVNPQVIDSSSVYGATNYIMYNEINDDNFGSVNQDRYYSMFTFEGNELVAKLVDNSRSKNHTWNTILKNLRKLSETPGAEEATDTAVREAVYCKMYPEKVKADYEEWLKRTKIQT